MSKKKSVRPHGHYCKICGEYKANEKFSGKGHAVHICKACSKLNNVLYCNSTAILHQNDMLNVINFLYGSNSIHASCLFSVWLVVGIYLGLPLYDDFIVLRQPLCYTLLNHKIFYLLIFYNISLGFPKFSARASAKKVFCCFSEISMLSGFQ